MTDRKRDVFSDRDGETQRSGKKRRRGRFLLFAVTLVIVLGVVVVAAYRDGTGFDVLRRYFNYGSAEKAGSKPVYDYDASASNRFAVVGDRLVVLSGTALQILDQNGGVVSSTPVRMESPALMAAGGRAVAYDVGGTALCVVDTEGVVLSLTMDSEEPLLAARLNEKGYLAVTAKKKNYKGCVTVYDEQMEKIFAFNSSNRFVTDAYVTDDGNFLAAVTLGQKNSVFVSNVVLYNLNETEPTANYDIADGLVLDIGQNGSRLVTVSDTCVTFADTTGEIKGNYAYNGGYLREYDIHGNGFVALLLNRYQSGSVGRLVTVGVDGNELGTLDVNREVLSLSACGRYLAVLYADSLVIYNQEMQTYATLRGTDYVKEALMRADGSVLLLSSESAGLFLP